MPERASRDTRVVGARVSLRERLVRLWQYRELLVAMVRKELKVKYKNSVLGFAWSLINPLLYLVVFYVAFQVLLDANIRAFPIYLLSGLLVWNLFSTGLAGGTSAIVGNAGIVNKVSFPREILPIASVGSALVHYFLQTSVLVAVLLLVRWDVAWEYVPLLPVALIAVLLITCALSILLSALNVYLRDTMHFLELALLAWFWMTPIVYQWAAIGDRDNWVTKVFMLNPITPITLTFQRAIYALITPVSDGVPVRVLPEWGWSSYLLYLGYSFAFGIVMLCIGVIVFGRLEANFAEEL